MKVAISFILGAWYMFIAAIVVDISRTRTDDLKKAEETKERIIREHQNDKKNS